MVFAENIGSVLGQCKNILRSILVVEAFHDCTVSKHVVLTDLKHQDMSRKVCSNEIGIFDEVLLTILMD